jgi:hypothetical protein
MIDEQDQETLAKAIGLAVGQIVEERCAALEIKINRLEAAIQEFKFVPWEEGKQFRAGNFTSVGGALFHAGADTKARPGNGSADWRLVAARGRDGKDGKDYAPPPQRTVRSAR